MYLLFDQHRHDATQGWFLIEVLLEYFPYQDKWIPSGRRREGFIPLQKAFRPSEIQTNGIWTQFIETISSSIRPWFIIIDMSCRQHGYPWPSLATSPCHSSLLAGLQGYIPYPHITAVCMFELVVLLLLGHMRGSIGVHHWWVRPCFSSSVLRVWFV